MTLALFVRRRWCGCYFAFCLRYYLLPCTLYIYYSPPCSTECLFHFICLLFCGLFFGYVWVYYVIQSVVCVCVWYWVNGCKSIHEIANQLCPSLRIKMTVRLNWYCGRGWVAFTHLHPATNTENLYVSLQFECKQKRCSFCWSVCSDDWTRNECDQIWLLYWILCKQ